VPLGQLGPLTLQTASTGCYAAVPGALIVPRMTFSLSHSLFFSFSFLPLSLSLFPLFRSLFRSLSHSLFFPSSPSLFSLSFSFFHSLYLSFSFFLSLSGFAQKKVWTEARPFRTFSMRNKKRIRNEIQRKKREKERERGSKNTVLGGGMLERRTR